MFITFRFCQDWEFRAMKIQAQYTTLVAFTKEMHQFLQLYKQLIVK
jgi:hypothetical protein